MEYTISEKKLDDLRNRFTYHAPQPTQGERYVIIRDQGFKLAELLCQLVPEGRELSLAITNLEQAIMWANAGIARNE